ESVLENEREGSKEFNKDLGRRGSGGVGDKNDLDSVALHLNLASGLGIFDAFFASFSMILVSEIGDETFIIAALMAMRHPKSIVLSGALTALIVMTVLSTGLGRIVPNLISRKHTNSAATVLYAFFGMRLLYIAWKSDSKASHKKEMEEVEEKLESGQGKTTFRRFFSRFCTPIFLESFILTFLAEWGDRSQIATIALATHKNAIGVAVGATVGHTICTSVAVVGGSMLASKISQGTVATIGGLLFLSFSLSSYFYPPLFHQFKSYCYHSLPINDLTNESIVQTIHATVIKNACLQNKHVGNYLLSLYVKSQNLNCAHKLFDEIPNRDVRSWTILLLGFVRTDCHRVVFDIFRNMQVGGVRPNQFTLSSVLKCCSNFSQLKLGKEVHGWILRNGIGLDLVLENSILDLYVKCEIYDYVRRVFESMKEKDSASWNIMLGAYLHIRDIEKSLDLFRSLPYKDDASWNTILDGLIQIGFGDTALEILYQMVESGNVFNEVTYSIALKLASSTCNMELGKQIHGCVVRFGIHNDSFIRNSLIYMYCKCGKIEKAAVAFTKTPRHSVRLQNSKFYCSESKAQIVSWSFMISGYVRNGDHEDAVKLFCFMVCKQFEIDKFTLTSIVSSCANSGNLVLGQLIHALIQKVGHKVDAHLGSSFVDMYAKCGCLDDAWMIFKQADDLNVVLWTSMISGCALNGKGLEALWLLECMIDDGIIPNEVTFVGVLTACSHTGLLEAGCKYFQVMKEVYSIMPAV
ncbi:UPF0016 domain-containing protein/PPR domain-containing protein/PPR_2 domain-containing protein, partial [Cephalotus follicularis]